MTSFNYSSRYEARRLSPFGVFYNFILKDTVKAVDGTVDVRYGGERVFRVAVQRVQVAATK
jgi:hypothetical protein